MEIHQYKSKWQESEKNLKVVERRLDLLWEKDQGKDHALQKDQNHQMRQALNDVMKENESYKRKLKSKELENSRLLDKTQKSAQKIQTL